MRTRNQQDYEGFLTEREENHQEQIQNDPRKYMLDDSTCIVKFANSTFWGAVMVRMFLGVIVWGIAVSQFLDHADFPVLVILLGIMFIGIILHSFAEIYRRITFNTATGEMTLRRLFRPTWRFHKEEITAMEAGMDVQFGRVSELRIHVNQRKIRLCIGRINRTVMESGNPGGIDKSLCDQSNMFELVEFLNVWERAAITELDHKLIH